MPFSAPVPGSQDKFHLCKTAVIAESETAKRRAMAMEPETPAIGVLPFRNDFARPLRYASAHLELAVDLTIRTDTAPSRTRGASPWGFF